MDVSVVIPTCNRRDHLFSVLRDLDRSDHPIREVLIVDASDQELALADFLYLSSLRIRYITSSRKSVCVQRNVGVREAAGSWIFLCDDDLEIPPDYLSKIAEHIGAHPQAGAVSGLFLERHKGGWESQFPVNSSVGLLWRYLFQLSIWGQINARGPFIDRIVERYRRRGNHISHAGWPVLADFSGPFFRTPVYSLGASVVKRDWLLASPYDEQLDPHGLGDNYGVAMGFPPEGIHVVTAAFVRHHKADVNRLPAAEAYRRRLVALHGLIASGKGPAHVRRGFFLWSLVGQIVFHASVGDRRLARAGLAILWTVLRGENPHRDDVTANRSAPPAPEDVGRV
jgi:glycosyltransferase involved in cell wall biosynthesis